MTALVNPYLFASLTNDPYFANVVLLCHFDSANGATSFTDSSSAHRSVTGTSGWAATTAQAKFGTASLQCPNTSGNCTCSDNAAWDFGAGQFTVELWARRTATGNDALLGQWSTTSNLSWGVRSDTSGSGLLEFYYSANGTTNTTKVSGAYTLPLDTWAHIAADRDASDVLRVYADGVVIASATVTAVTFFNSSLPMYIGADATGGRGFAGQIDEVRVTKGVARYGGAFTPPTDAFPNS
jgi:hypothetical protein